MSTSNNTRADRAEETLERYVTGKGEVFESSTDEITDLMADLLHLTAHYAVEDGEDVEAYLEKALRLARMHFEAEHENPEEEAA